MIVLQQGHAQMIEKGLFFGFVFFVKIINWLFETIK